MIATTAGTRASQRERLIIERQIYDIAPKTNMTAVM